MFDETGNRERVSALRERGVDVWGAERVFVGPEVDLDAIEPGAVLRQGALTGGKLRIGAGAVIGTSGPADVDNCQLGAGVELGSGLYRGATLLESVKVRGFAEIRPGTLLEESVDLAHCVALKNTTFTACCVAGSLINFCDLLLSGGTSRRDHTEIGSGAVHYNFDPRGDKWGSLLGGIRGVLLRSDPVFIGGHCGLVGPIEVGFGAVTAAGSTIRKDVAANALVLSAARPVKINGFDRRVYGSMRRSFLSTAKLIATLRALDCWYRLVRIPCAAPSEADLYESARAQRAIQIRERISRLERVIGKLSQAPADLSQAQRFQREHRMLIDRWEPFKSLLERPLETSSPPAQFLAAYTRAREAGQGHVQSIKAVEGHAPQAEDWLDHLVCGVTEASARLLDFDLATPQP